MLMAQHAGYELQGLDLIEKAADFLTPYLGKDVSE